MDELSEDLFFFVQKSGLKNKLDIKKRLNPTDEHKEFRFWSRVTNQTILNVMPYYCDDFLMFDYSPVEYMDTIGVNIADKHKLNDVCRLTWIQRKYMVTFSFTDIVAALFSPNPIFYFSRQKPRIFFY